MPFYDCLPNCDLKSNSEKSLEECVDNCELKSLPMNLDDQK